MEVAVVSLQTIKPSYPIYDMKPFNLSFFDQLTPSTYSPLILFYNTNHNHLHSNLSQIAALLKCSLSKTLTPFYPVSGKVKDNLIIHEFEAGVPFFEARVKGHLSDFLQSPHMEMLNQFLPCQPFEQRQLDPTIAQLVVQMNVFDCGGIALGLCFSHKIYDGITVSSFMKSWAANASSSYDKVIEPNLLEASSMFPPHKSLPSHYTSMLESLWFSKHRCKTRRFVFGANAISALRIKGRSECVENPTRFQALSAFTWRCAMKARKATSGSMTPSLMCQSVNIRRLTRPRMSRYSIGNLVLSANARYNPDETEMEMKELVRLVKEGVGKIDSEYLKAMTGDEGHAAILKHIHDLAEDNIHDVYSFSSWHSFGFSEIDLGWGKPAWVGIFGEINSDSNYVVFKEMGRSNAIEAWMTLDERVMEVVEHDVEFLAFANSSPSACCSL